MFGRMWTETRSDKTLKAYLARILVYIQLPNARWHFLNVTHFLGMQAHAF